MKQTVIALFMLLLVNLLVAQVGLFDIEFGQDYASARLTLEEWKPPFELEEKLGYTAIFTSSSNDLIDYLELRLDEDFVDGYLISFFDDDETWELLIETLEERHGSDEVWDEDISGYVWELENGRTVTASYDGEYITVEYL